MKKSTLLYILPIIPAIAFTFSTGCSYVMDYVEGRLTDRAAFSIEATYDAGAKEVTVTWDEYGSGDDFAGYEIYITEEKDDEYAGYLLVASRYEFESDVMDDGTSTSRTLLENYLTNTFTINVNPLVISALPQFGPGIYFFRVGLINWDEDDEEDRIDNYFCEEDWNSEVVTWGSNTCRKANYYVYTDIDKISGYARVEIY